MGTAGLTATKEVLQPASNMNKFWPLFALLQQSAVKPTLTSSATTASAMLATEATLAMATPFPTPLPATPASPPPPPSASLASLEPPSLPSLEVMLQLDVTLPTLPESSMSPRERLRLTPMFSATPATQATATLALAMLAMVATMAAMGLTPHLRM